MRTSPAPARPRAMTAREVSDALARMRDTRIRLARAIMGVEDPARYLRHAVALNALHVLPTVLDNFLADFEASGGLRRTDRPAERRLRAVQKEMERLLATTWRDYADHFTATAGGDRATGERWANDMGDVAAFLSRIVSFVLGYCADASDGWRLAELSRKLDELASPDARPAREGRVRESSLALLRGSGIDDAAAARRALAELDGRIADVEAARRKGMEIYKE